MHSIKEIGSTASQIFNERGAQLTLLLALFEWINSLKRRSHRKKIYSLLSANLIDNLVPVHGALI